MGRIFQLILTAFAFVLQMALMLPMWINKKATPRSLGAWRVLLPSKTSIHLYAVACGYTFALQLRRRLRRRGFGGHRARLARG